MSDGPILVTGGAGFLGAALVRRLLAEDKEVRVLDDASRGSFERLQDLSGSFQEISADVRDEDRVLAAAEGCEIVVHLAAVNGTRFFYEQPHTVLDVAIRGTLAAVGAARRVGVRRLLVASSSEVYHDPPVCPTPEDVRMIVPDPYNPRYSYAGGKIASELIAINSLRDTDVDCVVFRPHNVYGPNMGFEHVIPEWVGKLWRAADSLGDGDPLRGLSGEQRVARAAQTSATGGFPTVSLPIQGSGSETRAFCFVDDAVRGIAALLSKGESGTYNVGREQETSILELADLMGQVLGLQVEVKAGPPAKGAPNRRCPRMEKMKSLGFEASIDLAQGLLPTVASYWDRAAAGDYPGASP